MTIPRETFVKTSRWIKRNARPLEMARWDYLFNRCSNNQVFDILKAYQNNDGGFGHGIEPDFWLPHSSPMASWYAGRILVEAGATNDNSIVTRLIDYLTKACDTDKGLWLSVLPENNLYPHAPWWHWQENVQENWMFNPSAELAGFILLWSPGGNSQEIADKVLNKAVGRLMEADKMDFHEIGNYQQLFYILKRQEADYDNILTFSLDQIFNKLSTLIEISVEKDVNAWSTGYKPLPLDFVECREDPFCQAFGDLIDKNLLFYQEQLTEEGVWEIPWEWGQYPEAFPIARRYWKGVLAVERYKVLHSFNWIE